MNDLTISTQNYTILDSGSIIVQSGEYAEFSIANLNFRIIFIDEFVQDGTIPNGRIETRIEQADSSNTYLGIYLYNQNNAFFSSSPDLISVATLDNKKLFLKLSIQSINNGSVDKILFYSWYLSKKTNKEINNSIVNQKIE